MKSRAHLIEAIMLLEEKKRRDAKNKITAIFDSLYDWQNRFIAATASHRACLLMAANRVGKTYTGCLIDAAHATGNYPDNWTGHKFTRAPLIWVLGYSGEKIRDLLQAPLFGTYSNGCLEGGLITKDLIVDSIPMMGTARAVREVKVKHASGGISRVQFWSYTQGQHALMGDSVDWYHIDEEPKDRQIYPQVLTRTATGDNGQGGRGILTFTPENGRTELVISFMDHPSAGQYMQRATWDDAKHLTEETKETLLAIYPAWQRDMRTKGWPLLGSGLIFDLDVGLLKIRPFECPDHWWVLNGMDFGWDHPQAHVQIWHDRDEDIIYVSRAIKASKTLPFEMWQRVKSWAEGVPSAWPSDGFQTEKGTGKTQKTYYEDAGWEMLGEHATWQDGGNSLEQGIIELYERMRLGKIRIFDNLTDFFDELSQYHRDDNGNFVKVNDDILSAVRYAYMMRRHAIQKFEIGGEYEDEEYYSTGSKRW